MNEIKVEVKTFRIYRKCSNIISSCSGGTMLHTGMVRLLYPKEYEHICDVCGNRQFFPEIYPKLHYEEV